MKKELKKLPYITEELRRLLKEWNEREGFPFRYGSTLRASFVLALSALRNPPPPPLTGYLVLEGE